MNVSPLSGCGIQHHVHVIPEIVPGMIPVARIGLVVPRKVSGQDRAAVEPPQLVLQLPDDRGEPSERKRYIRTGCLSATPINSRTITLPEMRQHGSRLNTHCSTRLLSSQGSWWMLKRHGSRNGTQTGRLAFLGGHLIIAFSRSSLIFSSLMLNPTVAMARPVVLPITPFTS